MSKVALAIILVVLLVGGYFLYQTYTKENEPVVMTGYKDAEYVIEGERVKLEDPSTSSGQVEPATKIVTRYFGNELKTDLDGDGREDVVFLLTQESGGSGIFFYVVAALNTELGYVGSDGYFLGDRIAPQTTEVSQNPRHKNVIVVNYADRKTDEPMSAAPSVGKSVYLKLDKETMQWGIVEPDFEGESNIVPQATTGSISGTVLLGPTCPVVMDPPDPECDDKPYATSLIVTTVDGAKVIKQFSSDAAGKFSVALAPGEYIIRSAAAANILPYCQSPVFRVSASTITEVAVSCDTGIR